MKLSTNLVSALGSWGNNSLVSVWLDWRLSHNKHAVTVNKEQNKQTTTQYINKSSVLLTVALLTSRQWIAEQPLKHWMCYYQSKNRNVSKGDSESRIVTEQCLWVNQACIISSTSEVLHRLSAETEVHISGWSEHIYQRCLWRRLVVGFCGQPASSMWSFHPAT